MFKKKRRRRRRKSFNSHTRNVNFYLVFFFLVVLFFFSFHSPHVMYLRNRIADQHGNHYWQDVLNLPCQLENNDGS